jgi:hypothetical protein
MIRQAWALDSRIVAGQDIAGAVVPSADMEATGVSLRIGGMVVVLKRPR